MSTITESPRTTNGYTPLSIVRDLTASLVVFLVALPLCLGIALASGAPLFSGIVAGVVGGILVGALSGSHTSVSGPAAGLTAVCAAQIMSLGSFEAFLLAVVVGGLIQVALGFARGGFIAAFFPASVIKGLLAAIGVILVMKQIPHLLGHDSDPEGEMSFSQPDHENTFSEFGELIYDIHPGAAVIGLAAVALLVAWDRIPWLKRSPIPSSLAAVGLGTGLSLWFRELGDQWAVNGQHLVQVPVADSLAGFFQFIQLPDFTQITNPAIYVAGLTIAMVASLETLLNLEAVDKIDPKQRHSPPSRELWAQGFGNMASGLLGGLPITSVIVRSSVNINSGGQTRLAAIFHGVLLLVCVMLLPTYLNLVPLSCLAAILIVTGVKLASPKLVAQMWKGGRYQFIPFVVTVVAIVFTDLLIGILIGLAVAVSFILNSNLRRPLRRHVERHLCGDVLHIELANQVSFLNQAALRRVLNEVPRGGRVLIDARYTDYIDPDVLTLLLDFRDKTAPARGVEVSFRGFRNKYQIEDRIQYVDYSTRDLQEKLTPEQVLAILKDGHERFRSGQRLTRDLGRIVNATGANGQHPLAVVLSCIDSRTPAEIIFDLAVGDIFVSRIAGNIVSRKVLGSLEYGTAVAKAKLILVMGHTRCGAVTAAVNLYDSPQSPADATGCGHVESVLTEIQTVIDPARLRRIDRKSPEEFEHYVDEVAKANVLRTCNQILDTSETIRKLVEQKKLLVVGAVYDVVSGDLQFVTPNGTPVRKFHQRTAEQLVT
jgi:carbonic anhydrase